MIEILGATLVALVVALLAGPRFIRWLQKRGIGQNIRDLTPERHSAKQGTPTMGGVLLLVAALIPYLIFSQRYWDSVVVIILTYGSAAIGFTDDLLKQRRQRSLGLSARVKLLLQVPLVAVSVFLALRYGVADTKLMVPLVRQGLEIGLLYYVFAFFLIAGFSNAVNLTDGLDGLAAGTAAVAFFAYAGIAFLRGDTDLAILGSCMTGACVGFMWYNTHPVPGAGSWSGRYGGGDGDGTPPLAHRRVVRRRSGERDHPGVQLPRVSQAGLSHDPHPSPFRAQGLVGDQDHRPFLDRRGDSGRRRIHPLLPGQHRQVIT
jgi:UDP-N-acetylmuramyl pentapeptide phosphotransferase/UDP-N-acetylglucosamine-1-phosphate transferase